MKNRVRMGIIGYGSMARCHAGYFPRVRELEFTAACDVVPERAQEAAAQYGVKAFTDHRDFLDSGLADAVLISTPHYPHPDIAIDAFQRGIHVLCEKPLAVCGRDAQRMIAEHKKHPQLKFSVMLMMRTMPLYRKAREIVRSGRLGRLQRFAYTNTAWFRTDAYYASGGWRATWAGEGGGALINQCPHTLDLWQWILGMPQRVQAHAHLGKYHKIEVEDEVSAWIEYANGATGAFFVSTGETPGVDRFEIAGDSGLMVIEDGRITLRLNKKPTSVMKRCGIAWPRIEHKLKVLEFKRPATMHFGITRNFCRAVLGREELLVQGEEGIHSCRLGNALLWSGMSGKTVEFPMDDEGYGRFIKRLARNSPIGPDGKPKSGTREGRAPPVPRRDASIWMPQFPK